MTNDPLERLFAEVNQPADAESKARHIEAAKQAFSESMSTGQGNQRAQRPKENDSLGQTQRSDDMETVYTGGNGRWWYTGMASAAVLVLAVYVVLVPGNSGLPAGVSNTDSASQNALPGRPNLGDAIVPVPEATNKITESGYSQDLAEITAARVAAEEMQQSVARARGQQAAMAEMAQKRDLSRTLSIAPDLPAAPRPEYRDDFAGFVSNPVLAVRDEPVSTFSIDVDTASYSFVRRKLKQGVLPEKAAVRLEEMVNYFPYAYPEPDSMDVPFEPTVSVLASPWNAENKLVHIGIKGYEQPIAEVGRTNLVFLLDVSGSMNAQDKLPLVKQSLHLLLGQLHPEDTVAIVVYAGAAGTVLEPTPVSDKGKILAALNRLSAGGSTAGAAGIQLAYQLAESAFVEGGINRIMLATDGDFNVGITDQSELKGFVERKRASGIYLSVLGFGQGNYQDALMQELAQNGNGIATYIDSLSEARKVLVDEARSQLFPIANDVKIQVEFNPATVSEYRLLGYETRSLKREDFANDKVDAGEIGAGHTVTAIYEITPRGGQGLLGDSRYTPLADAAQNGTQDEYGFLKLRYKRPGETESVSLTREIPASSTAVNQDVRFSVAVAGFAQLLKDGKYLGNWGYQDALDLALANRGEDQYGYRAEFANLIRAAMTASALPNQ